MKMDGTNALTYKTLATGLTALGLCFSSSSQGQVSPRITSSVENATRATIQGSHPNAARLANMTGRMAGSTRIQGASIVFSRSEAQEAALQTLIAAQQNPSSPLYHQWMSPDEFATSFGVANADIAKVETWLQQQGLTIDSVSRGRNRIRFSGSVTQIEAAFGTEIDQYTNGEETHFAPATDLTIPAAFVGSISAVNNLSNFRPTPRVKVKPAAAQANFTSSQTQSHYLTPKDVATIYDINAAYNAGFTGAGQTIAVVGQSAVVTSDITSFQTAAGLTVKAPTIVLMPGSGTSTLTTGDEVESDLDLEYTGGIAKGANIFFVYTGNSQNLGVFDALTYAIDEKIAPILSVSYGTCEANLASTEYSTYNSAFAQAAAQGQTIVAASGDDGSTDCYENLSTITSPTAAQIATAEALAVDFPASSQYVTGLGGTEFTSAAVASSNTTYWTAASGSDVISSALSYMPEQVWNDDSVATSTTAANISSGGGGVSTLTARPTWQAGVTGITSGTNRLVPDIALAASPANAGYLYCSSDATSTGITGSCSNGFRDSNSQYLTVAGGTSFAAPIFAGMLAIINQSRNSTGQGLINPTLYTLAANATTYASAFHDTTAGSNACTAGSTICTTAGAGSYSATTGYDQASGLGSVDLYNLLTAWPTTTASALAATTTTLSAANTSPVSGASDVITITVAPGSSLLTTTPTGTVTISVDGTAVSPTSALSGGVATYTFSSTTAGSHVITATYSGDGVYAGSTGTVAVSVGATTATGGTFKVTATNLSVTAGSSGTSTVTVTPASGYTGTVGWTVSTNSTLSNACYTISNLAVTGTAAVSTSLTLYTSASACASTSAVGASGSVKHPVLTSALQAPQNLPGRSPFRTAPVGIAAAGMLALGMLRRRTRKGWSLLAVCLLGVLGVTLSGCSGSSNSVIGATSTVATKGTYTLTVVGADTTTSTVTSSANLTLTIN
jgi:hypothetical protein